MGADIKSLRVRIKSVDSTMHLTKAMGLVASSKIRRANIAMASAKAFESAVGDIISSLSQSAECKKSPYFSTDAESGKTKLLVVAGDRGMCGGYNANVFRFMRDYPDVEILPIGKRACERYGDGYTSSESFSSIEGYELAARLCKEFLDGEITRVGIVCTEYISMMTQNAVVKWILPLNADAQSASHSILFEPDEASILQTAAVECVSGVIMSAVRESFASEVAARRMAMDSADKNAQKMIYDLTLSYNRARQSTITQEITEIVAGSGE